MKRIEELKGLITLYDTKYREGEAIVPDNVYDSLVEELISLIGEDDEFFNSSIKEDINSERRQALPSEVVMASMNKVKTIEALKQWLVSKNFKNTRFVVTPKYDGISLCKEEKSGKAYTRGGKDNLGLRSDEHLKYMNDVQLSAPFTFGEAIISKLNWEKAKSSFDGDSARNGCSGLFRRDYVSPELAYVDFIRYGVVGKDFKTKSEMLDFLNQTQKVKVPYLVLDNLNVSEEFLKETYLKFSEHYSIDGLIIEVDDISQWNNRERNGNPKWAVAFKSPNFEEEKETVCIAIEDNISKSGNIIPVAILNPVKLDGAIVSRVTLNNYSFLKHMGIGVGSKVLVKRSGQVIPLITNVLTKKDFVYPEIEGGVEWDENGVHLRTMIETDDQKIKKIYAFFNIIGVENVSIKTFELLYENGYNTVKSILEMSKSDFSLLERFGERKSENVYNAIQSKTKDISLPVLQHASGLMKMLGKKKLILLEHFESKPSISDILKIEGFSDTLATNYLDGYDPFFEFIKDLPITWTKTKKVEALNNDLEGKVFCFSGFRDAELEKEIERRSGKISSSVNSKTTYLVVKDAGSGSSKIVKAEELGVIVLDRSGLIDILK